LTIYLRSVALLDMFAVLLLDLLCELADDLEILFISVSHVECYHWTPQQGTISESSHHGTSPIFSIGKNNFKDSTPDNQWIHCQRISPRLSIVDIGLASVVETLTSQRTQHTWLAAESSTRCNLTLTATDDITHTFFSILFDHLSML
jgi:hypothetical protein